MNFLAHAVLAGNQPGVIAGSLAGDFVKGVVRDGDFPEDYLLGIRLHRRIDAFSNAEPHLRASAARLPASLRRIAPPCIDMLADHLLAQAIAETPADYLPRYLPRYSPQKDQESIDGELLAYERMLHSLLTGHDSLLSPKAQRFFAHARATNLFSDYQSFARTSRGIGYVCERLGRAEAAQPMVAALNANMAELTADFAGYWPALCAEAERFLALPLTRKF